MRATPVAASLLVASAVVSAWPTAAPADNSIGVRSEGGCTRQSMANTVDEVLKSILAHDPSTLPLAQIYKATENSHPAALEMMVLWRTVTWAGEPSLLAVDTNECSAYFSQDISEGNDHKKNVLWARVKVVSQLITELELYVNRNRGDHGFSFSAKELPHTFERWMNPPADRKKASRADLEALSAATFNPNSTFNVTVASDCQFSEEGWRVVDPGPYGNGSHARLGCNWPDSRPPDLTARLNLVIDEEYGIVVTGAITRGKVYPYYGNVSAFIPDSITAAQEAQDVWYATVLNEGQTGLLAPTAATGETLQVLQYYDGKLQGQQIMLYLSPPNMTSAWNL